MTNDTDQHHPISQNPADNQSKTPSEDAVLPEQKDTTLTSVVMAEITPKKPAAHTPAQNVTVSGQSTTPPPDPKIAVFQNRVEALLTGLGDQRMSTNNYVSVMSAQFMTPELLKQGANFLWQATKIVVEHPYPEVIDVMWNFHVKHRKTLMAETHGLRGIQSLHPSANTIVSVVYTLFHTHAGVPWAERKASPRVDANQVIKILGDDRLYSYVINKRDSSIK